MTEKFKNYIDGKWVVSTSGKTFEQRNPANLDEVTGIWPAAPAQDVRSAIEAAQAAFPAWRKLPVSKRAEYLKQALENMRQRQEEIAKVLTLENGKTLAESRTEIVSAINEMEFQIHEGVRLYGQTVPSSREGVFAYSLREPLGVVSIISPWNFPFNVPGRKITPALMAGNTCVFKPASLTPWTGLKFVELFANTDLPSGVLNFVTGSGREVGDEMVTNPYIKAISFTGSTGVGQDIHQKAARNMVRTQLEMGGKNPLIVLEDADISDAAQSAVTAAFACAGQWCTSTSRAIVVKKALPDFLDRALELTRKIKIGNGLENGITMGPVCGTSQHKSILEYIEIGKKEGAVLAIGGSQPSGELYSKGCFIEPTIFTKVRPDMRIAQEEIFGPVLSVIEVDDFDAAVRVANQVDFGLASSIYTSDLSKAFMFLEKTEAGLTHVNLMTALKEPQLSFGGIKKSGYGAPEAGQTGIEFFTEHKVVYIKYR
jgi:aldehyde dehydrogenase (NAD+)